MAEPSGAELFVRYAYPPNELGYCGPDDADVTELGRRAREFDGAWVYLELIAEANGISDPLDARVVEGYWLGGETLRRVDPAWFIGRLRKRFRGQPTGQWSRGVPDVEGPVHPHHAFHVFSVYPWVGLLRRTGDTARSILDQCRIRTGVVVSVDDSRARVTSDRLAWDGDRLTSVPGHPIDVRWRGPGRSFSTELSRGDTVSVHWDWVCDVLDPEQAATVRAHEARQLELTNQRLRAA